MQYILICLFLWFVFSSFSLNIKNTKNDTDVLISFGFIIRIHLDYDKFIKRFNILSEPQSLTIEKFNNYVRTTFISKKIFDNICSKTRIIKFKIFKVINIKERNIDIFNNTMFLITSNYISKYLNNKFLEVNKEVYDIRRDDYNKNEYDFEFEFKIALFWIIIIFLKNIKTVFKIIKINKGANKNGPSNTYTFKGKLRKHKRND